MACRLDGAKPLSEPLLEYCWLDPWEQTSVKFQSQFKHFHSRKCIWKCCLRNGVHLSRPQYVKDRNWQSRVERCCVAIEDPSCNSHTDLTRYKIINLIYEVTQSLMCKLNIISCVNLPAPAYHKMKSQIACIGPKGAISTSSKMCYHNISHSHRWPLLLTWFNFNPSMD